MKKDNIIVSEIRENYKNISINVDVANINIKKAEKEVTEVVIEKAKSSRYSVNVENDTLIICRAKRKWYTYLIPIFKVPRITIFLPEIQLKDLTIKSNTSKINVIDMSCQSLTIKGNTGKINLEKVLVNEKVRIKTNTGGVNLLDSDAGEIFIKSNTGKVGGTLLTDKAFVIRCNTGKVKIPNTFGSSKCEIITNTGSINFEIKKS